MYNQTSRGPITRAFVRALLMTLHGAIVAAPAFADEGIEIAIPGQYLGADGIDSGDGWWGIYVDGNKCILKATTVSVSKTLNRFQKPGEEPTDVLISTPDPEMPLVIVRGSKPFRAGSLKASTWPKDGLSFLYPGEQRNVTISATAADAPYHVCALGLAQLPAGDSSIQFKNYDLWLTKGGSKDGQRQALVSNAEFDVFGTPYIIWTGDLDQDGRPDLIINKSFSEFQFRLVLFLSSKAGEGELVGLAAEWKARIDC